MDPGSFGSDFLTILNQYLKKWSVRYGPLHGFKVQMIWIQIYFWLIPAWAFFKFLFRTSFKLKAEPVKYLNSRGYSSKKKKPAPLEFLKKAGF
jgi:hypothetical protein